MSAVAPSENSRRAATPSVTASTDAMLVVLHIEDDAPTRSLATKIAEQVDDYVALFNGSDGADAPAVVDRCIPHLVLDLDHLASTGRDVVRSTRSSASMSCVERAASS